MAVTGRVVVAGHGLEGESVFVSDAEAALLDVAGAKVTSRLLFGRDAPARFPDTQRAEALAPTPPLGGCRVLTLSIGPGQDGPYHAFIRAALGAMADPEQAGFHATPTYDIVVVLEGELVLELDRSQRRLARGDTAVLKGVRHRWSNPGEATATLLAVQLGAEPTEPFRNFG